MPNGYYRNGLKKIPPSRLGARHTDLWKENIRKKMRGNTFTLGRKQTEAEKLKKSIKMREFYDKKGRITPLTRQIRTSKILQYFPRKQDKVLRRSTKLRRILEY